MHTIRRALRLGSDVSLRRGRDAETRACAYLQQRGLRLVTRNFRSTRGEVDLIMEDGATLVFVEVRYRRAATYGSGADSVDTRKQARIIAAALYYLQRHPAAARRPARFDVVALSEAPAGRGIQWIPDAFRT
jgi:putative endonuclease